MPVLHMDIEATEKTVTRSVIQDVVQDLVVGFGLPEESPIYYPSSGESETVQQSLTSRIGEHSVDRKQNVELTAQELFVEEDIHKTTLKPSYTPWLFYDEQLGIRIAAIYVRVEVSVNLTFRHPDRTTAITQFNNHRFFASKLRTQFFHEVHYSYLLPKPVVGLLYKIHELRESRAGYGEDIIAYFDQHFTNQMSNFSTRDRETYRLGKEEVQTGILGDFSFNTAPEGIQRRDEDSSYEYSFDYTFRYDKPITVVTEYPLVIHNQPLPSRFYDHTPEFEMARRDVARDFDTFAMDHWTRNRQLTQFLYGLPIPHFHNWYPPSQPHLIQGIARILLVIDELTPNFLFNIDDMGEYKLHDDVISILQQEYDYVMNHRHSIFYLSIFEDNKPRDDDYFSMDANLDVTTTLTIDPRKRYYAYLGVYCDLLELPKAAFNRLCQYGTWTHTVLKGICPSLETNDQLPPIRDDGTIANAQLRRAARIINSTKRRIQGQPQFDTFNVGRFVIVTDRR